MNLGRYRVEKLLGEGPRGEVYEAYDSDSPKGPLALKVLRANLCQDPRLEKQCIDLVHAIRLLPHPELIRLTMAGRLPSGRVFLAGEYVLGQTLGARLQQGGPLPPPMALHIAHVLAEVLGAAHKKGLAHLGLKPSNIMLVSDAKGGGGERIKLLDLGLAKLVPVYERGPYRAPEQAQSPSPSAVKTPVNGQADVYALGVLLHEMLTGRPRVLGGAAGTGTAPTVPLDKQLPSLSKDVIALAQAMVTKDPAQRPQMSDVASRLAQLEEDLLIGQTVGSYQVTGRIAQGGMGTVYRAVHTQIGRQAAIKVMRPQFTQTAEVGKRFLNEARAVNIVNHPGLVEIYEFGQLQNGRPYLVMEMLAGESLRQRREQRGGRVPEAEALGLLRQVALVVAATHEKGIIHRDLKPENVMIIPDSIAPGGERVKLLDFGIAKVAPTASGDGDATLVNTHAGSLMGTPDYMAPEQFSGAGAVTDRTDVYALGVMLYELLAGKRPYAELGLLQMSEPPPPLSQVAPGVSARTAALVHRMLTFVPAERPPVTQVTEELGQLRPAESPRETPRAEAAPEEELENAPTTRAPSFARADRGQPRRSWPLWLLAGGAAALIMGLGSIAGLGPWHHRPPPDPMAPVAPVSSNAPVVSPIRPTVDIAALRAGALATLREEIHSPDPATRRAAAAALGRSMTATAADLGPLLRDPDATVQTQAAQGLGQLGDTSAAPALMDLVDRTQDPYTFVAAAGALARLHDERGPRRLHEAVLARDPGVRLQAALALDEGGAKEARGLLQRLLQAPALQKDGRVAALAALAHGGDAAARGQLAALAMATEATEVRTAAARSLALAGDESGRALLAGMADKTGPNQSDQLLAARTLAELGDGHGCPLLRSALADPARPTPARVVAAEGLGACGTPDDAPDLGTLLTPGTPPELRRAAAAALLSLGRKGGTGPGK